MPIPDDTQPHLTVEQEMTVAVEFIREGFARLQAAGMRTAEAGPHAEALRRFHDHRNREAGILHLVDSFLGSLSVSLGEVGGPQDDEQAMAVVERLDEATSHLQCVAERVDRAREALAPLVPTTAEETN
ncbi:hypothetical protein ABZ569_32755 [Streptomyces albus]|uniref:hypothetical protein n=1 Tax=Streptomyces albus TaxID=1888 RepID=UPI0033CD7EFB